MTRPQAIAELTHRLRTTSEVALMNHLTERRLISDECVNLSDVPTSDLLAAVVALRKNL